MFLLIDNYDSFTFNIDHAFKNQGKDVQCYRNDQITIPEIQDMNPEAIILSPGPGRPEDTGICLGVIQTFYRTIPILGICLGHQAINHAFGGHTIHAKTLKHGKTSWITHHGTGLFTDLTQPIEVMRYHSLTIDRETLPEALSITATTLDDHEIMAIKHRYYPVYGLQFHPESIGTKTGTQMIQNFLTNIGKGNDHEISRTPY